MANIEYANPFGAYVKGQQEGTQNAIATGKAAREFRSDDLQHEFLKWYMPHKQAEVEMKQQQEQLATNRANLQMLASMAMSGDPRAQKMFTDFVEEATGGNVKLDFTKNTPEQTAWVMGLMSGQIPAALSNRDVFAASGVQRYGHAFLGNVPNVTGEPETAQEYPVFTANDSWMNGSATPSAQPQKNIFGTPMPTTPTITSLPEQPNTKVEPLNTQPQVSSPLSIYGLNGSDGSGGFQTNSDSGVIEHNYPPITRLPTMTVRPPTNEPTVAPSIWHDEVEQERIRGPVKRAVVL